MENSTLKYTLIRSTRRTISIEICGTGEIIVRCPMRMPGYDVKRFVECRRTWVEKHLLELSTQPQLPPISDEQLRQLKEKAKTLIPQRVAYFAPVVGVTYERITIRAQKGRWGSCSSRGNLNFNCLLMLVPCEVLDYIVVHELCHMKHPNHSTSFWAEVERVMPDYKRREKWLKENGCALIAALPK